MNFDPVGRDPETGDMYMKFHNPFTVLDKIQLLQRWILVQSFAYYELNGNVASDHQYDANARQLAEMKKEYPEEFRRSRYHLYFHDYCTDVEGAHYTSGFDLLDRVKKTDKDLYRRLHIDAANALHMKQTGGTRYV